MPSIKKIDIDDILARLPELDPLDEDSFSNGIDLFVGGYGFEDRANAIAETIAPDRVKNALFIKYECNKSENDPSRCYNIERFGSEKIVEIEYEKSTIDAELAEIMRALSLGPGRVVVDVSALASYAIYPVLDCIFDHCDKTSLVIAYCESEVYFPTQEEWAAVWENVERISDPLERQRLLLESGFQSTGIGDVYTSRRHPGKNDGLLPTRVIAFPNFGLDRIKAMISVANGEYDESKVTWFIGKPPNSKRNGWRIDATQDLFNITDGLIIVSTRAFGEILRTLEDTYQESRGNEHVVIATAGSKMQHVATAVFLRMRPEVGLVLCEPQQYNTSRFSKGTGPKWLLDFGPVDELKQQLDRIGKLEYAW